MSKICPPAQEVQQEVFSRQNTLEALERVGNLQKVIQDRLAQTLSMPRGCDASELVRKDIAQYEEALAAIGVKCMYDDSWALEKRCNDDGESKLQLIKAPPVAFDVIHPAALIRFLEKWNIEDLNVEDGLVHFLSVLPKILSRRAMHVYDSSSGDNRLLNAYQAAVGMREHYHRLGLGDVFGPLQNMLVLSRTQQFVKFAEDERRIVRGELTIKGVESALLNLNKLPRTTDDVVAFQRAAEAVFRGAVRLKQEDYQAYKSEDYIRKVHAILGVHIAQLKSVPNMVGLGERLQTLLEHGNALWLRSYHNAA